MRPSDEERAYLEELRRGMMMQIRGLQQQVAAIEKRLNPDAVDLPRTTGRRS